MNFRKRPGITALVLCAMLCGQVHAHLDDRAISLQVADWLGGLEQAGVEGVHFAFDDSERFQFTWLPGRRAGVRLDTLSDKQKNDLRTIFLHVLSEKGANKIDAIIATEAALAVITNSPEYRNPGKYYTAVFGKPGAGLWALRFEGHHLSVNLTFRGDELISATPLFLGANPETIPVGPDKGLRALKAEVDLARELVNALNEEQRARAGSSEEWFAGFLSDPGQRRADISKPAGISINELNQAQQKIMMNLIAAYVETIHEGFAQAYLREEVKRNRALLRFFWKGSAEKGGNYYYRISGGNLLIEQETQGDDSHIHAIWRDAQKDFGSGL